jgi:hypothetical protein
MNLIGRRSILAIPNKINQFMEENHSGVVPTQVVIETDERWHTVRLNVGESLIARTNNNPVSLGRHPNVINKHLIHD